MTIQIPTYSEKVLNRFAREEWGKVLNLLKNSFSLSEEDCEDVFQESFLILFDKNRNGELKDLTSSLSTFFIGICKNKAKELIRKKNHLIGVDDDSTLDALNDVRDDKLDNLLSFDPDKSLRETKEAIVRQIIRDLPEPCNKILWGFFRDNHKIKELAEMLNSTEDSIKVRKHRCQQKFRKRWKELVKNLL